MKEIHSTYRHFILSVNTIIKNKSIIILLIMIPFLSVILPVIFVPLWACGAYVVQVNVLLVSSLVYGTIVFGFKKSTLNKNNNLVIKSRWVVYMSSLLVMIIFVFVASVIQYLLLISLNQIGLLMPTWLQSSSTSDRGYNLMNMKFGAWAWSIFWTMIITFGIYFSLRKFIKTEKGHYFLSLIIIIVAFVWGGTLNDYWGGTIVTSDNILENGMIISLYPRSLYWPTVIIFPYFAPGQIASRSADYTIVTNGVQWEQYAELSLRPLIHFMNVNVPNHKEWNALIYMPIIWTGFLFILGLWLSDKK